MIKIFHPSRAQPHCHDLIAALALNDPGGDGRGVAVNGKCGSWLLIHGFPPFDGRPARPNGSQRASPWRLAKPGVSGSGIKIS